MLMWCLELHVSGCNHEGTSKNPWTADSKHMRWLGPPWYLWIAIATWIISPRSLITWEKNILLVYILNVLLIYSYTAELPNHWTYSHWCAHFISSTLWTTRWDSGLLQPPSMHPWPHTSVPLLYWGQMNIFVLHHHVTKTRQLWFKTTGLSLLTTLLHLAVACAPQFDHIDEAYVELQVHTRCPEPLLSPLPWIPSPLTSLPQLYYCLHQSAMWLRLLLGFPFSGTDQSLTSHALICATC